MVVFAIYILFTFFATPTADDYGYANKAKAFTPISAVVHEYITWASRYTQVFITTVRYRISSCNDQTYFAWLLIYIAIFIASIFYFIKNYFVNTLCKKQILYASLIICIGCITNFATLDESIYWEIGAITYILPASGILLLFTYLYKNYSTLHNYKTICIYTALSVIITGLNQICFVLILLYILAIITCKVVDKEFTWNLLTYLVIISVLGVVVVIAPGNSARMTCFPNSANIITTIKGTAIDGSIALIQGVINPYIWASILLFTNIWGKFHASISRANNLKLKPLIYLIFYLGSLYSIEFVHYWGTGDRPVVRLMTVWYIIFYIGLIPLCCLISPQLKSLYQTLSKTTNKILHNKIHPKTILLTLVVLSLLLINNFPKAVYDLSFNISLYLDDKKEFYSTIKESQNSGSTILEVNEFRSDPILLKTPTSTDYGISSYYGFKKMIIKH